MEKNIIIGILSSKLRESRFAKELVEADLTGDLDTLTARELGTKLSRQEILDIIASSGMTLNLGAGLLGANNEERCTSCGAVGTLATVDPSSIIGLHEPWRKYCTKCGSLQ